MFEIDNAIQNQRPLSGVILTTDLSSIHILVSNRTYIDAYKLNMLNDGIVFRLNLPFWNILIKNKTTCVFNDHQQTLSLIHDNVMIIPLSVSTDNQSRMFTIILQSWKYMTKEDELKFYDPLTNILFNLNTY